MSLERHHPQLLWIIVLQLVVIALFAGALWCAAQRVHIFVLPARPDAKPALRLSLPRGLAAVGFIRACHAVQTPAGVVVGARRENAPARFS